VPCHRVFICSPRAPRKTHAPPRRPCVPLFDRQRRGERGTRKHDPEPEGRPDRDLRVPTTPGGVTAGSTVHGFPLRDARGDTGARSRRDSRRQWAWERAVCVWPAAVGAWASRSVSVYFISVITAHSTHLASAANYLAQRCWANTNSDRECPAFS
jgi:hypothetical protein